MNFAEAAQNNIYIQQWEKENKWFSNISVSSLQVENYKYFQAISYTDIFIKPNIIRFL